jgi:type IV secretion system protein VirB4
MSQPRAKDGHARGTADLLNYAALIDDGLVLCKDGSLLAGFFFRGPDQESATPEERNYLTARVNAALCRLGTGFALWIDAVRLPSVAYPEPFASYFPDPVSRGIDEERRRHFLEQGAHFESEHALLVQYTPPVRRKSRMTDLVYGDVLPRPRTSSAIGNQATKPRSTSPGETHVRSFARALSGLEDGLRDCLKLRRMGAYRVKGDDGGDRLYDELVNYLSFCLSGDLSPIAIPPCAMYLDALLGIPELWTGDTPKLGETFIAIAALDGFPHETFPGILARLDALAIPYRFSTRFIPLDGHEAVTELHKYRRKWRQWMRGFWSQVFKTQGGYVNEDAGRMARQSEDAITDANSALVSFGYYTPAIALRGESPKVVLEHARLVASEVRRDGFSARIETVNALEAWLGSLPGHTVPNVRRPLIHSLNLADLLPLSARWPGLALNPNPLFPENSPPLLFGAAAGATPFRLNLHVSDVGHTLIFGPTGAGKSTLLAVIAAQFLRYRYARITVFDKGRSLLTLAHGVDGTHYDLGGERGVGLAPLAYLETEADLAFAGDWIESAYTLQAGSAPSPRQKHEIHRALLLLREAPSHRSLTDFVTTVQDEAIRAALGSYTIDGPLGSLLDARSDGLAESSFTVFEIENLMALGERNLVPALLALFRRFERSLTGTPALLILDEAWVMLGHPVFREKIRDWLKTLRKANCTVVLATQSLSDAVRSGLLDVLLESCPTRILLPNEEADKKGTESVLGPRDLYTLFGLNEAEIQILKNAVKKRHYYYTSPEGRRLFELALGPLALAFTAVSSREDVATVLKLMETEGDRWRAAWLHERGLDPKLLARREAADALAFAA